ncbi:MAG: oligosaccharide flippase family protein [Anaerolineae bacterium]|nr:oligosaccharide flippase family protein [Anaerolineae bacterium]
MVAVGDQLVFSGSNFLVSVLLARWMTYDDYGGFTYAYSLFLLLVNFHNALLVEPFTIVGSSQHRFSLRTYTQRVAKLQVYWTLITSVIGLPIGLVLWLAGDAVLGQALLGLALAQGATLYFWYVRRKWYVAQRIDRALVGTVIYAIAQVVLVYGLERFGALTPFSAFVAIGVAALIASWAAQISKIEPDSVAAALPMTQVIRENWQYGKWVMYAGILSWLTWQGYNILTGSILNLADAGGLKAVQNLVNPVTQLLTAFGLVFMPSIARRHAEYGDRIMYRDLVLYMIFLTTITVSYWLILVIFQVPIFDLLYDGQYGEYLPALPYLALLPIVIALTTSWAIGLRVLRQTRLLFWLDSIGGLLTISLGVVLVYQYGFTGVVAGSLLSSFSRLPVLVILWYRATHARAAQPQAENSPAQ